MLVGKIIEFNYMVDNGVFINKRLRLYKKMMKCKRYIGELVI